MRPTVKQIVGAIALIVISQLLLLIPVDWRAVDIFRNLNNHQQPTDHDTTVSHAKSAIYKNLMADALINNHAISIKIVSSNLRDQHYKNESVMFVKLIPNTYLFVTKNNLVK